MHGHLQDPCAHPDFSPCRWHADRVLYRDSRCTMHGPSPSQGQNRFTTRATVAGTRPAG